VCKKIVICRCANVCNYGGMKDILILTGVSEGQKARLTRLEKDRYVLPTRRKRILAVLDLLDNDNESD